MAAPRDPGAQAVIALDVGLGFTVQGQCLRCIQWRPADHLSIDQTVQKAQDMGLGWYTLRQGQFHGGQQGLFIVVQHRARMSTMSRSPPGLRSM